MKTVYLLIIITFGQILFGSTAYASATEITLPDQEETMIVTDYSSDDC